MKIRFALRKGSLMYRTILILCLIIIPFNLLSIMLSFQMIQNMSQIYRQSVTTSLNNYTSLISQRMENTNFLLYNYPTAESAFINMLSQNQDWRYDMHRNSLFTSIANTLNISESADAMFVYITETEDMMLVDKLLLTENNVPVRMSKDHLQNLLSDPNTANGRWHFYEHESIQYLIRIVPNANYSIGAYINCTDLLSELQSELNSENAEFFFSTGTVSQKFGYFLCSSPLPNEITTLNCMIRNSNIPKHISFGLIILIVFFLLSLLMVPLFIYLFRRQVNQPLLSLQNAFHELKKGNEDYRITDVSVSDEFTDTFNSFNAMAETISILRKKALEEAERQHALAVHNLSLKLDNLQLQIRPHFLLNTMNLLFTLIHNHQEENANRLVLYLSKYFRYMFRYGHELEFFSKEIELVKEYLSISEMHFAGAFTFYYQMDPMLNFMRFPPLLLHNFVENIIQHALIPGQTVHIVLYGEYNEDEQIAILQISDDGRGMSEEFAEMVNSSDFSTISTGKHIGIRNSINRLQYYYDGKASVSVETIPESGTTFTITIPQSLTFSDISNEANMEQF